MVEYSHQKGVALMKIIPMRDLKNTVAVEAYCQEEQGPVFVTKNGYGRLVVMDIEYYEKTLRQMEEAKFLYQGLEDIREQRLRDGESLIADMRERYDL